MRVKNTSRAGETPVLTASAYRTDRAEQRAQREAKEDLSKKEAGGDDLEPVCLHSTGAEQKHPEW